MDLNSSSVDLQTFHGSISAYRAAPASRPAHAGLVLVQEIFGVNAHIRGVAQRWAEHGYEVLAPRLIDFVEPGVELGYDPAGIERGRHLMASVGFERCVAACAAAADWLRGDPARPRPVGAVGFCIGGTIALLCCTRLGLPAVDYYGGRSLAFLHERPQAPLLMLFGRHDPLIPAEAVAAHRRALPGARLELFDAGHGFNCEQRADYSPEAAARAFELAQDFLREHLG